MEKYKYSFRSVNFNQGTVEASTLSEAMTKNGLEGKEVLYEFTFMAVIENGKYPIGVTWEKID